jgi:hypothetical protein
MAWFTGAQRLRGTQAPAVPFDIRHVRLLGTDVPPIDHVDVQSDAVIMAR